MIINCYNTISIQPAGVLRAIGSTPTDIVCGVALTVRIPQKDELSQEKHVHQQNIFDNVNRKTILK